MQNFCIIALLTESVLQMSDTVQLRSRGVLTLPKSLRDKYDLREGDSLHLVDAGGALVLTPMRPVVPEIANEIERLRDEAGLSTEELLRHLQEQRRTLTRQRYGDDPSERNPSAEDASTDDG